MIGAGARERRSRKSRQKYMPSGWSPLPRRGCAAVRSGMPQISHRNPNPFTGLPASDPFADTEWPMLPRRARPPFATLRHVSLLSSPYLLADNNVVARDSNRTSDVPDVRSDFNNPITRIDPGATQSQAAVPSDDWAQKRN
jgi:hypothetical protein